MDLRVVRTFADKEVKYKMYAVGEIISLPDERAKNAIKKGLAVEIAEAKVEVKEEAVEAVEEKKPTTKKRATKKRG